MRSSFIVYPLLLSALLTGVGGRVRAQTTAAHIPTAPPNTDVADVAHRVFARLPTHDSVGLAQRRMLLVVPVAGYSQQTGAVGELAANAAWQRRAANVSTLIGVAQYTQQRQAVLTVTGSVWLPNNAWNLVADWRVMHYPQSSYGLGMFTSTTSGVVSMDYDYLRLYQTAYRRVAPDWYLGLGLQLDDHWNIVSRNGRREVTRISRYSEGVAGRSISAGPVLAVLHDSRANAINPVGGHYLNVQYRPNLTALGSLSSFQTLQAEARTYLRLRAGSPNLLALWSYNVFTLRGNPPFLDMPATGWDTYSNTGRGFIQGRFRGKSFVYGEAEYRFGLTRDRLLGGVVFANAQSVTELSVGRGGTVVDEGFRRVVPALGAGLRVQLNKITRTNLCVDYGVGLDGSRGLSLNLGEVF